MDGRTSIHVDDERVVDEETNGWTLSRREEGEGSVRVNGAKGQSSLRGDQIWMAHGKQILLRGGEGEAEAVMVDSQPWRARTPPFDQPPIPPFICRIIHISAHLPTSLVKSPQRMEAGA